MFREEIASFVVPNSWFGVFDDMPVIAQASLDGSYERAAPDGKERIFAYGGWVGFHDAWRAFEPAWESVLKPRGMTYFRSTEARLRNDYRELVETLIASAKNCGLHAIGKAVDVASLGQKEARRKRAVFEHVVQQLFSVVPQTAHLALMCDREQDLAAEVGSWLERLKWEAQQRQSEDSAYERIAGICYLNSRISMQVQAADLAASLFREHAEQQRDKPGVAPDPLLITLTDGQISHGFVRRSDFLR